ncbi:hypothetical protein KEM52_003747, partial [Ascosphaera acerosa]
PHAAQRPLHARPHGQGQDGHLGGPLPGLPARLLRSPVSQQDGLPRLGGWRTGRGRGGFAGL